PQRGLEAHPLANRVEHGLAGDGGDAAAHLRVDDDPDHADHDDPHQLITEGRTGRDVEDEVADVDEAPDRGQDPERQAEDLAHGQAPIFFSSRSTTAPTVRSAGWSCSRCKVEAS